MLKLFTLLLVAVVAAKAYDFSDFDYNQFLFNEFELLNDEVVNENSLRLKRDAEVVSSEKKECSGRHGEWKNSLTCCSGDIFDPEHVKQMKEVKIQCALKFRANNCEYYTVLVENNAHDGKGFACVKGLVRFKISINISRETDVENFDPFDCEKMNRIKQLIICETECFARAVNILDESGKLDREAIIERYSEHFVKDSDWKKAAYVDYVDKCLAQVEAKEPQGEQQCSSAPMEFHHCVWGEFINGCPADLRSVVTSVIS
ncbi:hypothetical protein DOY81_011395 [Sarcophaga bullata]|nr:hypothetical protein DOY81_011395 [Sarcophaga bullata]